MHGIIFREDLKHIISNNNLPWADMYNSSVLITGATGMIGYALTHTLRAASDKHNLNLKLFITGRKKEKLDKLVEECSVDTACSVDIRKPFPSEVLPHQIDYIFQCASVTTSADMSSKPADVMETAGSGTRNILEVACEKNCKAFIFLSSMEVYGQTTLHEVHETDLGYIDLTNPRSSYPESKRYCEALCIAYATQHRVPVKIARLAQTFGAGTSIDDTRVFAQFARSAVNGRDIVLHTEGKSRGNYCYLSDTLSGLLYIALKGNNAEIYNIANPQASVTIREMADIVADEVCNGTIGVTIKARDTAQYGYAPDTGFILNADKLKALGWHPQYGLKDMYRRMIEDSDEHKVRPYRKNEV